jgi:hypothetical protein
MNLPLRFLRLRMCLTLCSKQLVSATSTGPYLDAVHPALAALCEAVSCCVCSEVNGDTLWLLPHIIELYVDEVAQEQWHPAHNKISSLCACSTWQVSRYALASSSGTGRRLPNIERGSKRTETMVMGLGADFKYVTFESSNSRSSRSLSMCGCPRTSVITPAPKERLEL